MINVFSNIKIDKKSFILGILFSMLIFSIISFFYLDSSVRAKTIFSPNSQSELISIINSAQNSIDLQMYILTSDQVALELANACSRGVKVRVILEKRTNSYNLNNIVSALKDMGVEVRWASENYKLTHSKLMIIDGKKVFLGSTNFSNSALTQNREASVLLEGNIVNEFLSVFEYDWVISTPAY